MKNKYKNLSELSEEMRDEKFAKAELENLISIATLPQRLKKEKYGKKLQS